MLRQENEIRTRVLHLVAQKFRVEFGDLSKDTRFLEDLQADSLDLVELSVVIEREFGYDISDDKMCNLKTLSQLVEHLEDNLANIEC